jgi:hypothetical protein
MTLTFLHKTAVLSWYGFAPGAGTYNKNPETTLGLEEHT